MKLLNIILFLLFSLVIQAQQLRVDYERLENNVSPNKDFSEEFKKKIIEQGKTPDKYTLYYNNGQSFFKSLPTEILQHENAPVTVGEETTTLVEQKIKSPTKIFKLKNDDHFYFLSKNGSKSFYKKVKQNFSSLDFKEETQLIDKFVCKLVEVRMTDNDNVYKVWYTEDLPISTGPFTYGDFPGLVLKVESPNFVIYATQVSDKVKLADMENMDAKLTIE